MDSPTDNFFFSQEVFLFLQFKGKGIEYFVKELEAEPINILNGLQKF